MATSVETNLYDDIVYNKPDINTKPLLNIKAISANIYDYFASVERPIQIAEIQVLKYLIDSLSPYYFVKEHKTSYTHTISIKKNMSDEYNIIPYYILDMTIYCNQRMILHAKFDDVEYTQYQIGNCITQIHTKHILTEKILAKRHSIIKIYDKYLDNYHLISQLGHDNHDINNFLSLAIKQAFNETINVLLKKSIVMNHTIHPINNMIKIDSGKYIIYIKQFDEISKYYNININSKKIHKSFEIISNSNINDVMNAVISHKKFVDHYDNDHIRLDTLLNIRANYIQIKNYDDHMTMVRKQIFDNQNIVFDGCLGLTNARSQMLINSDLTVNKFAYYDINKNKSIIFINVIDDKQKLPLPNFLVNGQIGPMGCIGDIGPIGDIGLRSLTDIDNEGLIKQYIMKPYSDFDVHHLSNKDNIYVFKTFTYDGNNRLIKKNTEQDISLNVDYVEDEIYKEDYTIVNKCQVNPIGVGMKSKKIYRCQELIYHSEIKGGELTILINNVNSIDYISLNNGLDNDLVSQNDRKVNKSNYKYDLKRIANESIITPDKKHKFEFNYKYQAIGHGMAPSALKNVVVSQTENTNDAEMNIQSIDQHNFDDNGQQKNSKFIDSSNRLVISALTPAEIKDGRIGYKAAQTMDNKMCIVKLFLPKDSKVAYDQYKDKYRTNKAIVLSIKKVYYTKNKYYYTKDFNIETCPICMDAMSTHIAYPCRHKLCGNCWKAIIDIAANKGCHYCRAPVDKIEELPQNNIIKDKTELDVDEEITEAYSCVHTDQFLYKTGEQVIVTDFDPNINKVCAPGIHFHDNESDVFQWFEYMDDFSDLHEDIPWDDDYDTSYTEVIEKPDIINPDDVIDDVYNIDNVNIDGKKKK